MLAILTRLPLGVWLRLGTIAIALLAGGLMLHRYQERGREITRLEAVISAYEEADRAQAARARLLTDQLAQATADRARRTETLHEEIRRAPESDDAPVAPVLRRTLDGLRSR